MTTTCLGLYQRTWALCAKCFCALSILLAVALALSTYLLENQIRQSSTYTQLDRFAITRYWYVGCPDPVSQPCLNGGFLGTYSFASVNRSCSLLAITNDPGPPKDLLTRLELKYPLGPFPMWSSQPSVDDNCQLDITGTEELTRITLLLFAFALMSLMCACCSTYSTLLFADEVPPDVTKSRRYTILRHPGLSSHRYVILPEEQQQQLPSK